jgi:hypothetical protein
MANPTCSTTTLVTDAAPFRRDSEINPKQQKCLLIYAMALELNAIGGTNYTSSLATTLVSDAATLTIGMTRDELTAALINLGFVRATAAGASVPAPINTKLSNLGLLVQVDDLLLEKIFVLLTCKLGVHKAYVQ